MSNEVIKLSGEKKSSFMNKVMEILPDGGNLNLCLTQFISIGWRTISTKSG